MSDFGTFLGKFFASLNLGFSAGLDLEVDRLLESDLSRLAPDLGFSFVEDLFVGRFDIS
jgi:hypothetical protein